MTRRPFWPVFLHSSSLSITLRTPLPGVLLCCLAHQAHRGAPLGGLILCRLAHQSLKGAQWVGSYSVVLFGRHLMGQPLYCSAADAGVWGERGYSDGSTPFQWLSSITLLPWLPGLPPQVYPTTVSSLTSPWSISLQSTAALALGLLHNPCVPSL